MWKCCGYDSYNVQYILTLTYSNILFAIILEDIQYSTLLYSYSLKCSKKCMCLLKKKN